MHNISLSAHNRNLLLALQTDKRFTQSGPVKCFNFGSPYVGGRKFLRAFHHQERQHLLMYARFFNHNDIGACDTVNDIVFALILHSRSLVYTIQWHIFLSIFV
jgi:hypothetical protein